MVKKRCRPRHLFRGRSHAGGCEVESWPHWHVTCRRCRFEWMQAALFDERAFEGVA
jgi:hypothetical protein